MNEKTKPNGTKQLGFGGGCHWCTEAVFDHLIGVTEVKQGWIKSTAPNDSFSEAVLIYFDPYIISEDVLVQIHLATHASTSNHSMRNKYRSAIYFIEEDDKPGLEEILARARDRDGKNYITKTLLMVEFQLNTEDYLHYYRRQPEAPFCTTYIGPKVQKLMKRFGMYTQQKIA